MVTFSKGFISRKDLGWPASAAPTQASAPLGSKIHYEGTPVSVQDHSHCKAQWTAIRNSHLANKAEGYSDIAYTLGVCRHGYVLEGRGPGHQTGANGNQALNRAHYSICVLYGTNDKVVSDAVITAVREGVSYLREHGAGKEIKGHRDGYATACPGDPLYALVKSGKFEPVKVSAPRSVDKVDTDMTPAQDALLKKIYDSLAVKPWTYKNPKLTGAVPDMHQRVVDIEKKLDAILAKLDK